LVQPGEICRRWILSDWKLVKRIAALEKRLRDMEKALTSIQEDVIYNDGK